MNKKLIFGKKIERAISAELYINLSTLSVLTSPGLKKIIEVSSYSSSYWCVTVSKYAGSGTCSCGCPTFSYLYSKNTFKCYWCLYYINIPNIQHGMIFE